VQPVIPTPGHGSLPSGHATDAYFVASLLRELLPGPSYERVDVQMRRLAYRIADNRVVAGLHFPMDSVAGCLLGDTLAAYFASACTGKSGNICGARFEGKKLAAGSATGPLMLDEKNGYEAFKAFAAKGGAETCGNPSDLLKRMWTSALNELHALGYTD
ncbi:MAG TPA: phosphatase PAP2 family protein, partial [Albitalea sp.]|jgi:hypothetical protein|nr:phosphatase PAP2 family protein [Albitalea sp.]